MPVVQGSTAILWLVCVYLLLLGVAVLVVPDRALRFLSAFAQTPRANGVESALRFLVGLAFVGAAPALRWPNVAALIGAFLAFTSLGFIAAPSLHRRFAAPAVARVARMFPLFGLASIILAVLLVAFITLPG